MTKEYLDAIEGPRRLKARSKQGRKIRNSALPLVSDTRPLGKVASEPPGICARRTLAVDKGVAPMGVRKVEEVTVMDSRAELERSRQAPDSMFNFVEVSNLVFLTPVVSSQRSGL